MIRSRRLALAAAVVALGLTACGDPNTTTPLADQPPVIHLAGDTGSRSSGGGFEAAPAAATADASVDSKIAFVGPTDFVYDGEFPDLGSSAGSWFFDPSRQPDIARIAALAASLGVQGDVRVVPAEQGGGWAVGPEDYSAAVLSVTGDAMHSWYLSSGPTTSVGFACGSGEATVSAVAPDVAPSDNEKATPGSDPAADAVAPDVPISEPVTLPECPTPTPPVGVPTKDEAVAKAKQLFTDWGYDVNAYQFDDVYADDFGASVNAYLTLDGMRAPLILSVGFGENASITFASGYLGEPQRGADYPTVGPAAGLERLKKQQSEVIGLGNTRALSSTGGVAEPAIAVPTCAPEAAAADACAVPDLQPVTVHLNSVKGDLTMIWDAANTIWLLPAYTFGTADGGLYTVVAVDDAYLQQPDPVTPSTDPVTDTGIVPTPEPAIEPPVAVSGTSPACGLFDAAVTVPSAPIEKIADSIVGKCLADAEVLAKTFGYQVRVTRQDGVDQVITDDLRQDRINVVVDGGVVTSVDSIG